MLLKLLVPFTLTGLTACNAPTSRESAPEKTPDRFHEKSFSWDAPKGNGLVKSSRHLSAKTTRFESEGALSEAVSRLEEGLRAPEVSDSLWKPIDYACDELALAVWNAYGTVTVGDSVVFDETRLKADCRYIGEDPALRQNSEANTARSDELSKTLDDSKGAVVDDREYPYKMIGESWDDFNIGAYKSTGGETQFKKHRSKLGFTAWYDTDATRIGIRIYLLNCSTSGPKTCYVAHTQSDWYANDDHVSKRDAAFGGKIKLTRPTADNNWTPSPKGVGLIDFRVSDAVISMHSADHAGLKFRAVSSSGYGAATEIAGPIYHNYVTW